MERDLFTEIVDILTPHMGDTNSRQAMVQSALFGMPVVNQIDWSGAANTFTIRLVTTLERYDTSAVVALLQALKTQVGIDKQARIDNLIAWLNGGQIASAAPSAQTPQSGQSNEQIRILFLAANPKDTSALRLGEEVRMIDERLRAAQYRDNFELLQHHAVRVGDLQSVMLRHEPHIVHFSGHGSSTGELILEDQTGKMQSVTPKALTGLFGIFNDKVRCVVLDACFSKIQADAIAQEIDCVVGMSRAIGDQSAIEFAGSFYQGLGYGRNVETAFKLGCNAIDLSGLGEEDTPKILYKSGVDKNTLKFM